jgi:hypothetical protein
VDWCERRAVHCAGEGRRVVQAGAPESESVVSERGHLYMSSERGHVEVVKVLLAAGAAVDAAAIRHEDMRRLFFDAQ